MKDQFANYVVQKVLETCDDHNRELILSRIKVHLNALKRYTYGKHIVARVEKLIAAGGNQIQNPLGHPSPFPMCFLVTVVFAYRVKFSFSTFQRGVEGSHRRLSGTDEGLV